jgi:hypothetical protein
MSAGVDLTKTKEGFAIKVRVTPRASKSRIDGVMDGALKVKVAAPPVEGAANEELARLLAGFFGAPKSAVSIIAGKSSRIKRAAIRGVSLEKAAGLLASLP